MDKKHAIELVKNYAEVVKQNFPVKEIILYGSYAKETAREDSDIDVAVILNSVEDDYLMSGARLFRLSRDIDLRIEPVLLEHGNELSGFLEEISKTGEVIYRSDL